LGDYSRSDRWLLAAILVAAILIRFAYLVDIADSIYIDYPVLDSCWYHTKALEVTAGDYLASSASFRVPLYVYFLAGCYALFGESFAAPLIIQAAIGALSCALIFLIGRKLFGRLAGAVAGFGFAFYRMAIYSDGEILPTTLFIFLMLLAAWFLLKCLDGGRFTQAALMGVFLGVGFLTRPDMLAFALAMIAVLAVQLRSKRGLRLAATVAIVFAGFLMLLGVRNYSAYDKFFILSPQGAVNLYIGNASFADGKTPVAPPTTYVYGVGLDPGEDSVSEGCRVAARETVGRELPDSDLSDYYMRKTLAEVRSDFPSWAGLMLRKSYYFLSSYERSDIKPVQRFIDRYTNVLKLPLLSYALVMPFGLVGLAVSLWRRKRHALVPAAGLLVWAVLTVGFFVIWRYRLPAVPFMLVLGGYAVYALIHAAMERKYVAVAAMIACGAALWAVSELNLLDVDDEGYLPTHIVNEGALHEAAGRYEEALEMYREASDMEPSDARPYYHMGRVYANKGMAAEARDHMDRAISLNPNYRPFVHATLGIALAKVEKYEEAAAYFEKALDADPRFCLAAYNLGLCQYKLDRREEAVETLILASEVCRDDVAAMVSVSRMLIELGEVDRGIALGRAALEINPRTPEALYAVGLGYEAQGRYGEAVAFFERALRYLPSSKELRDKVQELRSMDGP
jgi:tetratricopeptide (TPR) repeat protein